MADLERLLIEQQARDAKNPKKAAKTRRFLVAEGIYINTGEICPLPALVALRAKYKLRLFLDESISFGTLGKTGHGLTEHFNVELIEVDLIMAGMENSLATIGGFCVGSHFIVEHQRLSGLGYCFSASLPPLLTQAAISALDRFESEPQMFAELQQIARKVQEVFDKFSKLTLRANELSPVKHLYIAEQRANAEEECELLTKIANKCIAAGVAVIEARYLNNLEKHPIRQSMRVTVNRLLTDADIKHAYDVIERVSKEVL